MKFTVHNIKKSIDDIMRTVGYQQAYFQSEGEFSMVKKITGSDYPRFHLYIKKSFDSAQDKLNSYEFNLHLDQKKPSYQGSHAHSGEYDGPIIENEAERIKKLLA